MPEAMAQVDQLLRQAPAATVFLGLRAALLVERGDYDAAITVFDALLSDQPDQPHVWLVYGHALKTVGRQADSVAAYRRSLTLRPDLGEAYWSLANLKVVAFEAQDVKTMQDLLARPNLERDDRIALHYALGKGLEDAGDFEASFAQYQAGAAQRRAAAPHDANAHRNYVRQVIETFTPAFLAQREGQGAASPDPIFVVGLPRSGSTLVEQMLASHSAVEGVSELPDLTALARRLMRRLAGEGRGAYPRGLASLDAFDLRAAGEAYLAGARERRKLQRPFFVDKFPGNVLHLGLIHLILPRAKIVDVRRHPMACCFSGFKQHFAHGQNYSYDLGDLGAYYADYVTLTAHFDAVLPGRVHRLHYESLIESPEYEVRRLLDYCGLDYEPSCLCFHQSDRPVRTASSEQVRRPIFGHGVDHWKQFEPWLGPLKAALDGVGLCDVKT
jgi:tetratricopeptide (TPR) repeat protein